MFEYTYDQSKWEIQEQRNSDEYEVWLKPAQDNEETAQAVKHVIREFDENDIVTDVMVYKRVDHRYQILVRPEYYAVFFLSLLKNKIIQSFTWK
jgi:hypothetical protein